MAAGVCAQVDPAEFFPDKGGSVATAKRICATCDVRQDCLDYALTNGEKYGIWGGATVRERRRLTAQSGGAA
jgi:WhiB family redox-sensing transcriptional regulator